MTAYRKLRLAAYAAGLRAQVWSLEREDLVQLLALSGAQPESRSLQLAIQRLAVAWRARRADHSFGAPDGELAACGRQLCELVEHLNFVVVGEETARRTGDVE